MLWPFKRKSNLDSNEELLPEEQKFLSILAPSKLDWKTSRAQFQARYGTSSYHGWADVVALPPTRAISKTPLVFYMYWNNQSNDLPPEYLFADYMPNKDARRNHSEIEAELQATLGEGERVDTTNCLTRRWKFGIFQVELLTWPPELQAHSNNTLLDKNPDLAFRSSVAIKSELANISPSKELLFLVDLINGKEIKDIRFSRLGSKIYKFPSFHHLHNTHRNSTQLISAMRGTWPMAWKNKITNQIGLTGVDRSLIITLDNGPTRIINYKIAPARGSGGSELMLQQGIPESPLVSYKYRTKLLTSNELDAMDDVSEIISKVWEIECVVEHALDD
jgi:hypothetical protein